jgi:hypothetical protein
MRNVPARVLLVAYCVSLAVDPNRGAAKGKLATFWRPEFSLWHWRTGVLSLASRAELLSSNTATFVWYDSLSSTFKALKKSVESRSVFLRNIDFINALCLLDRLCGIVIRVPGYRPGGPRFDSRALQEKKSSGSGTGSTQPREYNWGATWKK